MSSAAVLAGKGKHRDRITSGSSSASNARLPARPELLPGDPKVLPSLVVEQLTTLLRRQLADLDVSSGSHGRRSYRGDRLPRSSLRRSGFASVDESATGCGTLRRSSPGSRSSRSAILLITQLTA